jgi:hypothetical protein
MNFWNWSVHVSTFVEVDTMVFRIPASSKMTSPPAYVLVSKPCTQICQQFITKFLRQQHGTANIALSLIS